MQPEAPPTSAMRWFPADPPAAQLSHLNGCMWVCELYSFQGRTLRCQHIRTQDSHGPSRSRSARVFHLRICVVYRPLAHALSLHHLRVSEFFLVSVASLIREWQAAHLNAAYLRRAIIKQADLERFQPASRALWMVASRARGPDGV